MFKIELNQAQTAVIVKFDNTPQNVAELQQLIEKYQYTDVGFFNICDDLMGMSSPFCNGWFFDSDGSTIPTITNECPFDDEGNEVAVTMYGYLDYCLYDFVQVLIKEGTVKFQKLEN